MIERFPLLTASVAVLTLGTLLTASLGGEEVGYFQWYGVAGAAFFGVLCAAAGLAYVLVTRLPKEDLRSLYSASVGWLPSLVGVAAFYWCRNQTWGGGTLPDKEFFSITAQVLPVLILASIVDIRSSEYLSNGQLFPSVMAATMGEYVCLKICAYPTEISARTFAVPVAALVIVGMTLIMGIAARWNLLAPEPSMESSSIPTTVPAPSVGALPPTERASPSTGPSKRSRKKRNTS